MHSNLRQVKRTHKQIDRQSAHLERMGEVKHAVDSCMLLSFCANQLADMSDRVYSLIVLDLGRMGKMPAQILKIDTVFLELTYSALLLCELLSECINYHIDRESLVVSGSSFLRFGGQSYGQESIQAADHSRPRFVDHAR